MTATPLEVACALWATRMACSESSITGHGTLPGRSKPSSPNRPPRILRTRTVTTIPAIVGEWQEDDQ